MWSFIRAFSLISFNCEKLTLQYHAASLSSFRSELYRNLRFSSMRVLPTMKPQLSFVSLLMSAPDDSEIEHPTAMATSFTPAIQQPFLDRFKRLPSFEFWCTVFAIGSVYLTYSAFFPTSVKTLPNSKFLSNNRISDITIRTYCIVRRNLTQYRTTSGLTRFLLI